MILAIDPGANLGWAIFSALGDLDSYGVYKTDAKQSEHARRREMKRFIQGLYLDNPGANTLVVESNMGVMHSKGSKVNTSANAIKWLVTTYCTTLEEADARGMEIVEYAPTSWKSRLFSDVEDKRAAFRSKKATVDKVNSIFGLELKEKEHNAADAIAMGIVYLESQL